MFKADEYIYEHTVPFRTELQRRLADNGYAGMCTPWTLAWIRRALTGTSVNAMFTAEEVEALLPKQKLYLESARKHDLTGYFAAEKLVSGTRLATDRISYNGGLVSLNESLVLKPGDACLVKVDPPTALGAETAGHAFGLFQQADSVLFFDQNFGLLKLTGLERLNEEYTREVQLYEDELKIKLRWWEAYPISLG